MYIVLLQMQAARKLLQADNTTLFCISRYTFSFLQCAGLILYVQDRSCKHRIDPVPSGLHLAYLTSSDSVVVQPTQQPYLPFGVFDVSFKSFEVLLILVVHLLPNLKI